MEMDKAEQRCRNYKNSWL